MTLQSLLNGLFKTRRPTSIALSGLRKKASKLGVTIEIERHGAERYYWLHGTGWEDDNFCASKEEVEDKLDRIASERK